MIDLGGKTALVTGSTDGVGRVVAQRLASAGAHVLIHGRDRDRAEATVAAITEDGGAAEYLLADLASLAEVRRLAAAVRDRTEIGTDIGTDIGTGRRLDILINNAGIGTGRPDQPRQTSADGHELRFAVNYLAPFLLTHLLLPLIEAGAPARVVNVASAGQQAIDFDDVMLTRDYSGRRAYCQSKLALIMFTIDLAAALGAAATVNALHPATFMNTTMVREAGIPPASSVEQGAEAILNLATAPGLATGRYFSGLAEARPDPQALDPAARRRLRTLSLELTGAPDPAH